MLAFFPSMSFLSWNHSVYLGCELSDWFLYGLGVSMEHAKYLLLLLVIINMISSNSRFVMSHLQTVLKSNQFLTRALKNVKM